MPVDTSKDISFEVQGGCCTLTFSPGWSIGREDDTNPGVGFDLTSTIAPLKHNGIVKMGCGVIGRADAARLRDMLDEFLSSTPAHSDAIGRGGE